MMGYKRTDIVKNLKENADYFPFEQIRQYNLLIMQAGKYDKVNGKPLLDDLVYKEYMELFSVIIEECQLLLKNEPSNMNADLWSEAIIKLKKLIKS